MTHIEEQDLIVHYYGESSREVAEHLAACDECRRVADGVASFLSGIEEEPVPEPSPDWESGVWSRLEWRLGQERRRNWKPLVAVAALILVAFVAGLLSRDLVEEPETVGPTEEVAGLTSDEEGRNRVFLLVVSDHLDRSERVLVELTHDDDLPSEQRQARAEELLTMNRLYRLTAAQGENAGLAALLEELEPVLVEIARSSTDGTEPSLEPIRKRVEDRELIFKLRVVGQQVRKDAVPAAAPDVSI